MKAIIFLVSILLVVSCSNPVSSVEDITPAPEITHTVTYSVTTTSKMDVVTYTGPSYSNLTEAVNGDWSKTITLTKSQGVTIFMTLTHILKGTSSLTLTVDGVEVSSDVSKVTYSF